MHQSAPLADHWVGRGVACMQRALFHPYQALKRFEKYLYNTLVMKHLPAMHSREIGARQEPLTSPKSHALGRLDPWLIVSRADLSKKKKQQQHFDPAPCTINHELAARQLWHRALVATVKDKRAFKVAARAPATKEEKNKALGHDQDSRALQFSPLATVMPMENAALVNL